jgi:hypothetical protein
MIWLPDVQRGRERRERKRVKKMRGNTCRVCYQRLDDVEIYLIVVIPNTCSPPRDRSRECVILSVVGPVRLDTPVTEGSWL